MRKMQSLREVRRVTAREGDAVWRTEHSYYAWIDSDLEFNASDPDELYCSLSTADSKARNHRVMRMVDPNTPSIVKENR